MVYYKGDKVEVYWVFREQRVSDFNVKAYHYVGLAFTVDRIDENGNLIYKHCSEDEDVLIVYPKQVKLVGRSWRNWLRYLAHQFRNKFGSYWERN